MFSSVEKVLEQQSQIKLGGVFEFICRDKLGNFKWRNTAKNLVVNEGLNHVLNVQFHGTTQITTWYVGLKLTGTPAAGDTLSSHASWTEATGYVGNRKEYNEAAASGQSITNSANKAGFTINGSGATILGGFICSVSSGTTGTLFSAADFTGGAKGVSSGDTLEVTYTLSAADDGA